MAKFHANIFQLPTDINVSASPLPVFLIYTATQYMSATLQMAISVKQLLICRTALTGSGWVRMTLLSSHCTAPAVVKSWQNHFFEKNGNAEN